MVFDSPYYKIMYTATNLYIRSLWEHVDGQLNKKSAGDDDEADKVAIKRQTGSVYEKLCVAYVQLCLLCIMGFGYV